MEEKISEDKLIEERKEKFIKFFKTKVSWFAYAVLILIIGLSVYIRTLPMKISELTGKPGLWDITTNNWTLGPDLDPFLFLRYAKEIVLNGSLMAHDTMRYVPLGYDTARETMILPYSIAYLHKIINLFGKFTVDYAAIILPVIFSVLMIIFFFLLVRKIFENTGIKASNLIALVSTAFMVVLPVLLPRTIAGIPEKESLGFAFMFLSLYLFLYAWKAKTIKRSAVVGILSGLSTALMGLVWGGVIFVYIAIAASVLIDFILGKVEKKEGLVYFIWLLSSLLFWMPFTTRFGSNIFVSLKSFFVSSSTGIATAVLFFIACYFIFFKTKIKDNKILQNPVLKKIPEPILAIIIGLVLMFILGTVLFGFKNIASVVTDAVSSLTKPYNTRLLYTVAENRQPYFTDWKESMGPSGITLFGKSITIPPLFFWMFFVGNIILFYEMIKKLKERKILTAAYLIFTITLIFSRLSTSSRFNGENTLSLFVYFGGYFVLLAVACYAYYKMKKENRLDDLKEIKFNHLFILSLLFVGMVAARSAIRLIMLFVPIAAILVGYLVVRLWKKYFEDKRNIIKMLAVICAILISIASIYSFITFYKISVYAAETNIPSSYTQQWQKAMSWVRENTSEEAVFGHWWDYGYWLQSIGDRATMLDGGNSISYWNYLMGRHGLTAQTEEEALELFYNHNISYFLIDSTDIGKYSAYSSIGSDENYDRYSWIGAFTLSTQNIQETKEKTIYLYTGGVAFDEDLIIKENGKDILLPKEAAGVGALLIYENENGSYSRPEIITVYKDKQYKIPLRYLYINEKSIDFGTGENVIDAGIYVMPKIEQDGQINNIGAAIYLSPRNMKALWVKLYLLNQGEHFKLVHSEPSSIIEYIESQSVALPEIVYYQGIQGPIKIWEVDYTGNEKANPEYLQTDFPEEIKARKYS